MLFGVAMVFAVTVFIFGLSRAAGDPRYLYANEYTTPEQWEELGRAMGLDKPLVVQYLTWLSKAIRGDFGKSLRDQRDAWDVVWERVPATMQLALGAFIFTTLVGVPLGVLSAVKRGSVWDYAGRTFALLGQAMPGFWMGIVLIMLFAVQFDLLPTGRRGDITHFILPTITLGWYPAAGMLRLVRSAMLQVLDSEYLKLARAKGVGPMAVIWKHAFRNALIAPLTYAGLLLAALVTGAVVTETVFAWPGLGRLGVSAVFNNDFPVMVAVVSFATVVYVGASLLVDIVYAYVDPRIRYS